jgi:hypothetical protein
MIQSVGRHETPKCSVRDGLGFRSLAQEPSSASKKVAAASDKAEFTVLGASPSSAPAPMTLGTHEDVSAMADGDQGAGKISTRSTRFLVAFLISIHHARIRRLIGAF